METSWESRGRNSQSACVKSEIGKFWGRNTYSGGLGRLREQAAKIGFASPDLSKFRCLDARPWRACSIDFRNGRRE